MQQGNARGAIGIVLDRRHTRRYPMFIALEIDLAVGALGSTTAMSYCQPALVIAPAAFAQRLKQRFFRRALSYLLERRDRHIAAAGRGWLVSSNTHRVTP